MREPAVLLKNITKRYYLEKPRTFKKWFNTFFSPFSKLTVIDNFSLNVYEGEFVLITGPNGCGKTTLLKLIAGIIKSDKGIIKTYGRVVPLIELGAGFNNELTGQENAVINATILGVEKKKIKKIMPKIINFSGLKDFIDTPVKRYSSGMISRLAFSIAIYSEPDILLLDEIFAVGDEEFRKKSLNQLEVFKKKGVTIILCSHYDFKMQLIDRFIKLSNLHARR
ncbi:MAG: hypothetical protein A2857_02180 [Candidatus Levybacteria bacterium RIFCSPHIGHO2_01_FULL_36_15]|nr:MAG: hypothetical protein A2857_02180 [Candidatus Levybacteria bacterium RIFCSPHIGHO2_01_FULL_36_15]